jgi:hypothetical protein
MKRKAAETFAATIFQLIIDLGGSRSTAHQCCAVWWKAIENGEFDEEQEA